MTLPPLVAVEAVDSKPNPNFDKPARKVTRGKPLGKTPTVSSVPMPAKGVIKDSMMELYGFAAMTAGIYKPAIGTAILESAERCADSWEALATTNESVRRVLMSLTKTSAWGGVLLAHAPIAMAVYAEVTKPKANTVEENREDPTVMSDDEREATL